MFYYNNKHAVTSHILVTSIFLASIQIRCFLLLKTVLIDDVMKTKISFDSE